MGVVNKSCHELFDSNGRDSLNLRQATSPQRQRMLSTEESDSLIEAVLTQRSPLLNDPDLQMVLRKSYSLDDLMDAKVWTLFCSVSFNYLSIYFSQLLSRAFFNSDVMM